MDLSRPLPHCPAEPPTNREAATDEHGRIRASNIAHIAYPTPKLRYAPVFGVVSVAWTVKLNAPVALGVPVMLPAESIDSPVGREPDNTV